MTELPMIYSFLVGELSGHYIVRPHLTLAHDSLDSIILESVLFIMVFDALMSRLGVELLAIYAVISQLLSIVSVPSFVYSTTVSIYLPEAEKIGEVNVFLKNIFKNS